MIPQHRGDKRAASCGWLFGSTLPAAVMGALRWPHAAARDPLCHVDTHSAWPFLLVEGLEMVLNPSGRVWKALGYSSPMLQTHFPGISLQWFGSGETPIVSSSAVPASQGASLRPVFSFFISVCAVCHRGNLRCLGLFSAAVFKSKCFACTIKNVVHDTLSDTEIYNQIKLAASIAKQLNWQLSGSNLNLEEV